MKITIFILQWRIDYASFVFFRTDGQRWIIDSFFNRRFSSSNKTGCHLDHRIVVQWRWRTNTATPLDTRWWRNGRQRSTDDCPQPSRSSWYGRSSLVIKRRHWICNCQFNNQPIAKKKGGSMTSWMITWLLELLLLTAASLFGFVIVRMSFVPTEMFDTAGGDEEGGSGTGGNQTTSQIRLLKYQLNHLKKKCCCCCGQRRRRRRRKIDLPVVEFW